MATDKASRDSFLADRARVEARKKQSEPDEEGFRYYGGRTELELEN